MTKPAKLLLGGASLAVAALALYVGASIHRGFSTVMKPSALEVLLARTIRQLSVPARARAEQNPWKGDAGALRSGREEFIARCAICHGIDGTGRTQLGVSLYPRTPDLASPGTQSLSDGEIHYIIENGVRLTGMPGWAPAHRQTGGDGWKLVLFIRSLGRPGPAEQARLDSTVPLAHFVGSPSCRKCHEDIYRRWTRTAMANVVRDPAGHPDAIIPDLAKNPYGKFTREQVALVYGSIWKQRYFTKVGDDYFPEPAQWDIVNHLWRPYFVAKGTDWWEPYFPPDNMKRPTGELCDGCHSVGYDIKTKQVAEWNVGCEKCHGPGSEHVEHPRRDNVLNPSRMDYVAASDTCIQCHSQGRPPTLPIAGHYYDWPVGFQAGLRLQDYWKLEDHELGTTTFTHFADGTAHKNRMQGNDFVQSAMYRHGVTCFSCHDVHGTDNYAQLRKPASQLCLDCHGPMSPNGPRAATIEGHTRHRKGSSGSQCVACHMPKIETTVANVTVSAHTFRFIPPEMTDKYKIPNSCNSCHADKSTEWAENAMRQWPDHSPWQEL
jgi:predicted CXXCH cytochrome family protein